MEMGGHCFNLGHGAAYATSDADFDAGPTSRCVK